MTDSKANRLLFTFETRAVRYDGVFYNPGGDHGPINYASYQNYLHSFSHGTALIRSEGDVRTLPDTALPLQGTDIDVEPLPPIRSAFEFFLTFPRVWAAVSRTLRRTDRHLLRLPGIAGMSVGLVLLLRRRRYAVEFVGHPTKSVAEIYKKRGRRIGPAMLFLDWVTHMLIKHAVVVGYRSHYLQSLFPHPVPARMCVFSGAMLKPVFITKPRPSAFFRSRPFTIISIGRLSPEKGHMTLLHAFAGACKQNKKPMRLRLVGSGLSIDELKASAKALNITERCEFCGQIEWGEKLFSTMDDAHLFVLPSLTEGMPRSLIEAMARGMPALGSRCGGIPELLPDDALFEAGNTDELTQAILNLIDNPERLAAMSESNFKTSKSHWSEALEAEKSRFWNLVLKYAK